MYSTDPRDGQQYTHNYLGVTFQWLTLFRFAEEMSFFGAVLYLETPE